MKTLSVEEFQELDEELDDAESNDEETEEDTSPEEDKPKKLVLTKEQEAEIFKALAHKSYKQVGYEFGFQHFYKTDALIRSAILKIANKIRKAPELWKISTDLVAVVDEAAASRSVKNNPKLQSDLALEQESFRDKLDMLRDKAADILHKKLDKAMKTKGGIDGISIRDLKDLLATTIDKSRLLRGESTENIIKLSKIDTEKMSPEEALNVIMKARDMLVEGKK